jgi:ABC-2 type transport system ATP-binding protein
MSPAVVFHSVTKQYSARLGEPLLALDRVDFQIERGEFFGLLGPNGAGKTSLIQIMAGLSAPSSGHVEVLGERVDLNPSLSRRRLGVVPQELVFDPFFTVRETLEIQSGFFGLSNNGDWIDECLESLGLADKAQTNLRALSGGMKRRVLVAQALVHRPPVIVLDEPTAGVDIQLRESLWSFIGGLNKKGHTILLTTHYLEEAEALCGRVAFLKKGRLMAVRPTHELLAQEGRLESVFRRILSQDLESEKA